MSSSEIPAAVVPTRAPVYDRRWLIHRRSSAAMSATPPGSAQTLGETLERDRLERRVSRMTVVVESLRRRASENGREAPRRVRQTIADLQAQTAAINVRLRDLDRGGGATTYEEWSSSDEFGR
jgi:hypothetical protein